ncbi:MAG: hypothetical protein JWR37_500 [Mycobacterium sp.]|nr:hypothetical protein [Mycobacterium sp.]
MVGGQELYDALDKQHVDLFGFNAEIWKECDSRRAAVESSLSKLVRSADEIHGGSMPSGGGFATARVVDEVKTTLDRLVGRSPVGVLRSLEKAAESDQLAALVRMFLPDPAEYLPTAARRTGLRYGNDYLTRDDPSPRTAA